MAISNQIVVIGNLTADPELKFTQNGLPFANFTIASTDRRFDKEANEWIDADPAFFNVTVWRDLAEHVAHTLSKGMRVVAVGKMKQRAYETKEGDKRTAWDFDVEEVGPSLRYATATVVKAQSNRNQQDNQVAYTAQNTQNNGWAPDPLGSGQQQAWPADDAPF